MEPILDNQRVAEPVKARLRAGQDLLVASLYNTAPLLDRMIARDLLTRETYAQVLCERTRHDQARRLLDVVHVQMDDDGAQAFIDCLKECVSHYPRLRSWLHTEREVQRGPAETRLRSQAALLCHRLGHSLLPVCVQLFSDQFLTAHELELVQMPSVTAYQQTHTLISICLSKGEQMCTRFYLALEGEDPYLAKEMQVCDDSDLHHAPPLSHVPIAVEESGGSKSAVLQEAAALLGVAPGTSAELNMCEVGVATGLQRTCVQERLLEETDVSDMSQLGALVSLYIEKTRDGERLLRRLRDIQIQRVRVSPRGILLLQFLQNLQHRLPSADSRCVVPLYTYLVCDCLPEAVELPAACASVSAAVRQLRGAGTVNSELVCELEECLGSEPACAELLQSVPVLAQVLRDLYPLQKDLVLEQAQGSRVTCRPRHIHRVTCFKGVGGRAARHPQAPPPDLHATPQVQYRDVRARVARMLARVRAGDVESALAQLRPEEFDAGVRWRVRALLECEADEALMPLLWDVLHALQVYLRPSEAHSFLLHPVYVKLLGGAPLGWAGSVAGPVAIDDGIEQVYAFETAGPASMLVSLRCHGYEDGAYFHVEEPRCYCVRGLGEAGVRALKEAELHVLGAEPGSVWVKGAGLHGRLHGVTHTRGAHVEEERRCCFLITTAGTRCEVRFIYTRGTLRGLTQNNCEVV